MVTDDGAATFEEHRRHLTGLAYRMLGSVAEAEDVVQDAYLRWHRADRTTVADPRAYLSRTVARLCLDHLKSARVRRETYIGPWLPEPVVDEAALAAETSSDLADDLSVALMLTLERLSPPERAAFILHDVFDMGFDAIAAVLDRNPAACRQLAARARARVRDDQPRFSASSEKADKLATAFHQAVLSEDVGALGELLAHDAVLYADGGGRRSAALNPIRGRDKILRFFAGIARKGDLSQPFTLRRQRLNGLEGFIIVGADGEVETLALEIDNDRIAAIYAIRNPDKLRHLLTSQN
jgi:RNA polymerase sigma-70 factor, ECF subfamily